MKILHKYILKQISVVFAVCLIVFTFVLFVGNLLKIVEMMSKGVSMIIIMRFLVLLIPFMLSYSIPVSILTAILLVFARLSADNEITSIKASGINLSFIFRPILAYAVIMVGFCFVINDQLRPNAIYSGRKLLLEIGMQKPMLQIAVGRFNEVFPDHVLYIGKKEDDTLKQVVVYKFEKDVLSSVITAEKGKLLYKKTEGQQGMPRAGNVFLKLYNGVIEEIAENEQETGKLNKIEFETYNIEFNVQDQIKSISEMTKKEREMSNKELKKKIKVLEQKGQKADYNRMFNEIARQISSIKTRMHNRLALSFSCLAFVLIGIPLGIRVHRSETSIGAGVSLMLVAAYYFLMTLGEAFQEKASLYPWLMMWFPDIVLSIIGIVLIYRLLKK